LKIAILGAGALGCAIGAALTEGGSEAWLIRRSAAMVDILNTRGLRVRDHRGERTVRVRASTDTAAVGPVDLLVVLVKSFDTVPAMAAAPPLLGPATPVLSLQNGLGNEALIAEAVGQERVLAGRTYVGGQMLAPGCIISGTRGKQTWIGEPDGRISDRVLAIAAEFEGAGLATIVSPQIASVIWDKLLVNVATGALSGITGLAYGELYAVPAVRHTALAAVAEGMAVARAAGIALGIDEPEQAWLRAGSGLPPDFKASVLQSLEQGSVTEIEVFNGAIVREGLRLGVPTPVNAALVGCIKGIEHGLGRRRAALASV
jgi:2-dehydropantoate 2-reductase